MREYSAKMPNRVYEAQQFGDVDLLIEKIEARAEAKRLDRLRRKAAKAKLGIRKFSFQD